MKLEEFPELGRRLIRVKQGLAMRDADPLAFWQHSSPQSRQATELLNQVDEVYARAANKGGKTEWEYAVGIAILQKRSHLDGVPLPQWRSRVEGISLELDHEQQKLSSQQTVLRLLGRWPHHAKYVGDALKTLRIMPVGGSSDESRWSTLTFMSQKNMATGTGVRADLVLGNEPPREDIWREIRKAAHAGRRIVRIIGATPTTRRQWAWLKEDYGKEAPRDGVRIQKNRAEVRWSLHHNSALTKLEVEALLAEYWGDPSRETPADALYDARVFGDYIDTSGMCPYDIPTLVKMLDDCRDPEPWEFNVQREVDGMTGRVKTISRATVDVLEYPKPGVRYYLNIDPSKGMNDRRHDPGGILVCREDTGEDVAMYEGYLGSYGLGSLAAGLHKQYNGAMVDPESNSGWAEGVMRALGDAGCNNVTKQTKTGQDGKLEVRWGFITDEFTRPAMFAAGQHWVEAHGAGVPYARCRFRRVIETFMDVILDDNGRPAAGTGTHDEFAILKGQQLRKLHPRRIDPNLARPTHVEPAIPSDERTLGDLMKLAQKGNRRIGAGEIIRPKVRPRG